MLVDEFKTSICSAGEDGWDDGDWEKKENAHPAFADSQFPHQELAGQMFRHVRSYFVTLTFCHIQDSWRTCVNCVNPVFTDGGRSAAAAAVLSDITIVLDEESVDLAGFVNLFVINPQYIILDNLINYSTQCSRCNDKFQISAQTLLTEGQVVPSPKCDLQLKTLKRYLSQMLLIVSMLHSKFKIPTIKIPTIIILMVHNPYGPN